MANGSGVLGGSAERAGGIAWSPGAEKPGPVSLPRRCSRRMRGTPAAAVALLVTVAATCAPPPPDLVLLNAHIFTADPSRPFAEAVAIRGNRIVAVGSTAEVTPLVGRSTVVRDLGGRAVIPGLNDAHVIDPGLTGPALLGFAAMAAAVGVTSMQWFVGERTVRDVGAVLVAADIPQRIRVLRMPRPGPEGTTIDSRPHLPPQPTPRVDIRGMGFTIGQGSGERLRQAVGWAYGSEDLLAVEPQSDAVLAEYVDTVDRVGLEEVWARKRPRVERAGMMATSLAPRLRAHGMVVVQRPDGPTPLASLVDQDVRVAVVLDPVRRRRPLAATRCVLALGDGGELPEVDAALEQPGLVEVALVVGALRDVAEEVAQLVEQRDVLDREVAGGPRLEQQQLLVAGHADVRHGGHPGR